MKKNIVSIFLIALIVLVLFWNLFLRGYASLPSAEHFVNGFYDQYNSRDFDYIYEVLSDQKIRSHIDRPRFQLMMQETYNRLGPIRERKRTNWKAKFGRNGTYFLIAYKVKRAKVDSIETFTLIQRGKAWFVFDYVIRAL